MGKEEGWFEKTDRVIMSIVKTISYVSGVCLVGIMIVAFFNVLGEKILHHGLPGSTEIITYLHVPVVFLAAAYVTLDNGHTTIDLLLKHFPRGVQKVLATIANIIACCICMFVSYNGFVRMGELMSHHTRSSTTGFGFPIWPFALLFSVGMIELGLTFIWSIVRQYASGSKENKKIAKEEGGAA